LKFSSLAPKGYRLVRIQIVIRFKPVQVSTDSHSQLDQIRGFSCPRGLDSRFCCI